MTEWPRLPIREFAKVFDGPHATPASSKTAKSGPVFLGISSLQSGRLDLKQSAFLSEDDFERWTRRVTPASGDVVFSYETRLGEAALVPSGLRCCLGRRLALMRPQPSVVDPRFLLYSFLGPDFQEVIRANTVQGSTVDRILLRDFPSFEMALPPIEEQRAIAGALGALDDKIESNRRATDLAEALLDALAEGATASLPSAPLASIAEFARQTIKPESITEPLVAHFSLPAFDAGARPEICGPRTIKSHKIAVREASVLISRLNPRIDRTWWAVPTTNKLALASTEFAVLTAPSELKLAGVWLAVRAPRFRDELPRRVTGTSGSHQRVRPSDLITIEVPDVRVLNDAAAARALALLNIAHQKREESVRLAALRDALLPELLSGQIRMSTDAANNTTEYEHA